MRTHGGTETTVDLEHGEFIEDGGIVEPRERVVWYDLLGCRRLNFVPDTKRRFSSYSETSI